MTKSTYSKLMTSAKDYAMILLGLFIHSPAADKTEGVPNLTAEVTALFYLRFIVEDVASR